MWIDPLGHLKHYRRKSYEINTKAKRNSRGSVMESR